MVLDDVNGDGIQDIAYGSWDNAVRLYSGVNGSLLWRTPVGSLNGGDVWAIDRVADVTGDGVNDVCCGSFDENVYLMNGVTGEIVWRYSTGNRVLTVRGVPDLDGNGAADVIAGTQMPTEGGGGICYALQGGSGPSAAPSPSAPCAGATLAPAAPNPFRGSTAWSVRAGGAGAVDLTVFALSGRKVTRLALSQTHGPDAYAVSWDGRDAAGVPVPAGSYYARLLYNGRFAGTQRAVVIR